MKILITGGAGFIGSHTADALLARGYSVRVLDVLDPQVHDASARIPEYLDSRVEFIRGDVRCRKDVESALDGVGAVYHFAAQTGVGQSMYDIHSYNDVNVNGTAMLLDVVAKQRGDVRKIILSSSRAVYGEGTCICAGCGEFAPEMRSAEDLEAGVWDLVCPVCRERVQAVATREDRVLKPASVYALTKRFQEDLLQLFAKTYLLPVVTLRYFNVYGTRQSLNNPYTGIGAIFTNRLLSGLDVNIYEDGQPGRDFVHVRDVVQANLLALENPEADNGIFNAGSGENLTVLALAENIKKQIESQGEVRITGQYRVGDIRNCHADLSRSRSILGYVPQVRFEDGVRELVGWARGQELVDRLSIAEQELERYGIGKVGRGQG